MRSTQRLLTAASAVTLSAVLAACGTPDPYGPNNYPVSSASQAATYPYGTYPGQPVAAVEYGRVMNVSLISAGTGPAPTTRSAAGGVIGAIVGGLLGNQIGSGSGRAAATVLGAGVGAVAGAQAGRAMPSHNAAYPVYRVTVQTDQGIVRTYDVNATADLRVGDRVRVENGVIYLA